MKIRSITCFINPGWPLDQSVLQRGGDFITAAKAASWGVRLVILGGTLLVLLVFAWAARPFRRPQSGLGAQPSVVVRAL